MPSSGDSGVGEKEEINTRGADPKSSQGLSVKVPSAGLRGQEPLLNHISRGAFFCKKWQPTSQRWHDIYMKESLQEVEDLAQGHTVSQCQGREEKLG